jgi:hypothetical protein
MLATKVAKVQFTSQLVVGASILTAKEVLKYGDEVLSSSCQDSCVLDFWGKTVILCWDNGLIYDLLDWTFTLAKGSHELSAKIELTLLMGNPYPIGALLGTSSVGLGKSMFVQLLKSYIRTRFNVT